MRKQLDERIDPTDANTAMELGERLEVLVDAVNAILWHSWPVHPDSVPAGRWQALITARDAAERSLHIGPGYDA